MEVFVGINRNNAPGVFRVVVPMTDHSWRGFCECGAPTDALCRLDEKRMDAVVARFRAWAYVRVMVMRDEVCFVFSFLLGGMKNFGGDGRLIRGASVGTLDI